ncbi:hypothetical protein [Streptomyces antimicrobicus]|uniref:hypothetical protein n=1 Tax=Streptomyces antimicrobicus TaxID=2883108 RepID=UPI0035ABEE9C
MRRSLPARVARILRGYIEREVEGYASPLAKKVYDLRHTCLTNWLNDGVPPAQVAEWAGNGVPVPLAIYARCIVGHLKDLKHRIEAGGDLPEA